jgi:protein TonB
VTVQAPRYAVWLLIAGALHAVLLFGVQRIFFRDAAYSVTNSETVDLDLVDSAPTPAPANIVAPPSAPPEPVSPPEPEPQPVPVPESAKPEFVEPNLDTKPTKPKPSPKPATKSRNAAQIKPSDSAVPGAASTSGGPAAGGANVRPAYLYNPHPAYPAESRANGEKGLVLLMVGINEQGNVISVKVRQSSGFPRLDSAATEGVRSWRFRPARLAGFPVASTLDIPIRFQLGQQ